MICNMAQEIQGLSAVQFLPFSDSHDPVIIVQGKSNFRNGWEKLEYCFIQESNAWEVRHRGFHPLFQTNQLFIFKPGQLNLQLYQSEH